MDPTQAAIYAAQFHPPGYSIPLAATSTTTTDVYPSSISAAANPSPPPPPPSQPTPPHPSYTEMITSAIQWENTQGKEGSGSSKRAIAKYIDRVYSNLPASHSALLTHHLKRLKNAGQLVMIKNSYQLPSVAPPPSIPTPLRSAPPPQQHQHQQFFPPPQQQQQQQFVVPPQQQQQQFVVPPQQQHFGVQVPAKQSSPVQEESSNFSPTPKRKPGRPAKPKQQQPEEAVVVQAQQIPAPVPVSVAPPANGGVSLGKRPRGRPPRNQQQQVVVPFVQPAPQVSEVQAGPVYGNLGGGGLNNGQVSGQKRRGRPKKQQSTVQEETQRPPVFQVQVEKPQEVVQPVYEEMHVNGSVEMVEVVKRRSGRPARGGGSVGVGRGRGRGRGRGVGRGRGRPRREVVLAVAPVSQVVSQVVGKKARGWPKGKPRGKKNVGVGAAPKQVNVGGVSGPKRRGRKPKGSIPVVVQKERKLYTGKPRGRPRKNFETLRPHTSGQEQDMANEELRRKLEDMQLRIRDAVAVIRPYIGDQNGAVTALQQLEDLTTMDFTASQTTTAPTMMTMPMNGSATSQSISEPESLAAAAPMSSAPTMMTMPMTMTAPPAMTMPLPFSVNMPAMAATAPMPTPSGIESQQPMSWIPSSGAQ